LESPGLSSTAQASIFSVNHLWQATLINKGGFVILNGMKFDEEGRLCLCQNRIREAIFFLLHQAAPLL
jgi:predicted metallopeptidase